MRIGPGLQLCKLRFCELELKYFWCEGFGLDMVVNRLGILVLHVRDFMGLVSGPGFSEVLGFHVCTARTDRHCSSFCWGVSKGP